MTCRSPRTAFNHTCACRPLNAADSLSAFWADGDPAQVTLSRLYFSNSDEAHVWQLPYNMPTLPTTPELEP